MKKNKNAEYEIYKELRCEILLGEIKEGEWLVETTLAVDFHVSRLHIKNAPRLLEQRNLTQHAPQYGSMAKGVIEEAIEGTVELRTAPERVVFKRLVRVITGEETAQLRRATQRAVVFLQNDMMEDAAKEVDHLYSFVYEKSRSERITSMPDTYIDYLKITRRRSASNIDRNQAPMQLLQDIMGATEKGDMETLLRHIKRRRTTTD